MNTIKSVLVTGANAGLGREAARQLALQPTIEKIYLGCRNRAKAELAQKELIAETRRNIFDIVILDVASVASVKAAVADMKTTLDAVILNAGGTGGQSPFAITEDGVTTIFATNVLGHLVLVNELIEKQLLTSTILYAGSEAARGIPKMGIAKPELDTASIQEFASIANGEKFDPKADPLEVYGTIKLVATFWMASMARRHPHIRFVTMSPGGTTGTNGMDDLPFMKKLIFKYIGSTLMPLFGMMHNLETGAKRYVDGLLNSTFQSGHFYASRAGSPTGPVVDQLTIDNSLGNIQAQDSAWKAVQQFA